MVFSQTASANLLSVFYKHLANDSSKYLVPRMPFFDSTSTRRIIDLAILSPNTTLPRVAVLLLPPKDERTNRHYLETEKAKQTLQQQNWVPVVFTAEDLMYRANHVRATLDDIYHGRPQKPPVRPGRMSYLMWLRQFVSRLPKKRLRHVDVIAFTAVVTAALCFSAFIAVDNSTYRSFHHLSYSHTSRPSVTYVRVTGEHNRPAKIRPAKDTGHRPMPQPVGRIVPVIDLDTYSNTWTHAPASEEDPRVQDPMYTATVLYCYSGLECQLKRGSRLLLWGVSLPDNPIRQGESMAVLNQLLAGREVVLETRNTLPDGTLVARVTLQNQDVARLQVRAGLLVPQAYENMYNTSAPSGQQQAPLVKSSLASQGSVHQATPGNTLSSL